MRAGTGFGIALALLATHSLASDGVLEINETCAYLTGCFPGDAPLLPVTITAEGKYRLTSNLPVGGANVTAIEVAHGPAVDIDLNGFVIQGIASCLGIPATSCGPAGSGVGVSGGNDVSVHDGTIRGMGNDGIRLSWSAHVENVNVVFSVGAGIRVGQGSLVRGSMVASNGGRGISADLEARILDNLVSGNGLAGIHALSGVVTNNSSARNGGLGGEFDSPSGFDVKVAFSGNSFERNTAGSVAGGAATGGNVCDDGRCTRDGARRYYLTPTFYTGVAAINACATGFHMAALSELHGNALRYDLSLGTHTPFDQGSGAPRGAAGWVRTGAFLSIPPSVGIGAANCEGWSSPSGVGTYVMWGGTLWGNAASVVSPWSADTAPCASPLSVWCVED
jgi:hypothetical protein